MKKEKQKKISLTFRENEKEKQLYNWIREKGQVGSIASYIKTILYREMEKEEK
jgi:hypothetical protein